MGEEVDMLWILRSIFKLVVRLADHWFCIERHSPTSISVGFKWDDESRYSLIFETPCTVANYQLSRDQAVKLASWILESVKVEDEREKKVPPPPSKLDKYRTRNVIKFDSRFKPFLTRHRIDGDK